MRIIISKVNYMDEIATAKKEFFEKKGYPLILYFTCRISLESIPALKSKEKLESTMDFIIAKMEKLYGKLTEYSFGVERLVGRDAKDLSKGAGDPCSEHCHFHGFIVDPHLQIIEKYHNDYKLNFEKLKTNHLSNKNKLLWSSVKKEMGLDVCPPRTLMMKFDENKEKYMSENLLMYPLKQFHCGDELDKTLARKFFKSHEDFEKLEYAARTLFQANCERWDMKKKRAITLNRNEFWEKCRIFLIEKGYNKKDGVCTENDSIRMGLIKFHVNNGKPFCRLDIEKLYNLYLATQDASEAWNLCLSWSS